MATRARKSVATPAAAHGRNLDAIRVTTLAVAVVVLAIVVVINYKDEFERINWPLVVLIFMLVFGGYMIYRWQSDEASYDLIDLFKNHDTGKADLWKHFAVGGFALSVWVIVQTTLAKLPVTEMLLGVLTVFVGKVALDGFSKAIEKRPAAPEGTTVIQSNQPQAPVKPVTPEAPLPVSVVNADPVPVVETKPRPKGK